MCVRCPILTTAKKYGIPWRVCDQYLFEEDIVRLIILKGLCYEVIVLYSINILARFTEETGAHTKKEEDTDAQ